MYKIAILFLCFILTACHPYKIIDHREVLPTLPKKQLFFERDYHAVDATNTEYITHWLNDPIWD